MRIGIDARFFGPQQSGIGRYVERLVSHIERIDQKNEYVLFLRRSAWDWWQPKNDRWKKVEADYHWYSIDEQLRMPGVIARQNVDVMHFPHFNVPLFYTRPFVVTIHDLILNQFPTERATTLEPMVFKIKYAAYQAVLRHAMRSSRAIITVSQYSRDALLSRFSLPPEKVRVTYESVDPLPEPVPFDDLQKHGIRQPYILAVGNAYPHKNLERLVDAARQAANSGEKFQLVLVGKRDYFSKRLEEYARSSGAENVIFFGFASEQELAALYAHAKAYFFPSLIEGFGLPGLEAMQAGVPVFAARASCLPEVFGDGAAFFDPHSTDEIAASIRLALHDTILRERLIASGRQRIQKFSWSTMAQETLRIYEQASHHAETQQRSNTTTQRS